MVSAGVDLGDPDDGLVGLTTRGWLVVGVEISIIFPGGVAEWGNLWHWDIRRWPL
jgi:hypothetical protein